MRIKGVTHIYPINGNTASLVPAAPTFFFENTGNTAMYVNNKLLQPGDRFGVDHSTFLATFMAMGKQVEVDERTSYNIRFGVTVIDGGTGIWGNVPTPVGEMVTVQYHQY